MDVVADCGRAQRVVADCAQHRANRRAHDAKRNDEADEIPEGEEPIDLGIGVEAQRSETEEDARLRHPRQAVLAAGEGGQRIEFDEEEYFGNRHRNHREVNAGAAQCDQADQITDRRGNDRA